MYRVTNPTTGITSQEFNATTDTEADAALRRAAGAFPHWRDTPVASRCAAVIAVADSLLARRDELAELTTTEMGKPITAARAEIETSAAILRWNAEQAPARLRPEPVDGVTGACARVQRHPLGVVLGVMPWNFPFYQVARFAGPVLVTGNTVLLKHAPQCPTSALAWQELMAEQLPVPDSYVNVFATNEQVADLIGRPEVQGVSLTGSERAGSAVGAVAGAALKKVVLELGGSDPFIVLDDHDIDSVADSAVAARLNNSGQACAAPKRFIVAESAFERFAERFVAGMSRHQPADPREETTIIGPLASEQALRLLHGQVTDAVDRGARLHTGGHRIGDTGAFYAPTVLSNVTPGMRAYTEELFGPASVLYRVADDAAAVELANDSPYGLGSTVYAADEQRALDVARQLEVGMVAINGRRPNVPALPFGGVKRSGFGRELGCYGLDEFVNHKVVAMVSG
ncbi:succinate-semialdehyde dehydrogenase/glutarate-semialdehyde dehydrogenase [Tamaricihabitans halophyticus]|uniref:Succinate-semialdehyde dehydrogenase/glutarate-semialdehyde dehydrogenase n=1 Tax=Tamaricihabitans halophyticus TaxID=1262583 RepID=A0A4R2QLD2_9PSEU|nr:aldehyde dehydrogenase family protein [Tamaricihabitans halophyticus]TCP47841.1 succinate-semialdehyde dehydrogenase/glutarate-semialdehyde dehydrogenase [Tamaricihabitans halophyticus]